MTADPTVAPGVDDGVDVLSGPDLAGRVVRGGVMRAIGFGIVNLLGLAGSVVLLRYLGVDDYGRYGTVIALVGIASGLGDVGLNVTGSRELALMSTEQERRHLMGSLLGARLLLLTATVVASVVFAAAAGYDSAMLVGTAVAGVGAVLVGAQSTLTLPLVVQLRNGLLSLNEIFKQLILFAGIVALATVGAGLTPFFVIQLAVGAGALLAVPLLVDRRLLAWPSLSRHDLRHLAFTAFPVALAAILTTFYMRMLVVIASLLTSAHETGLFVISARVVEMISGLAMLVMGVILPVATVAARDDRLRLRYVLAHTTKLALLSGGLLALVVVVAAKPIVVVLGGHEFASAAPVLRLQGPVILTTFLVYAWTAFLIADGRRRALVQSMLIGTVALLVAGVALIAQLDAKGAGLAAIVADVVLAAVILRAVRRVGDGGLGVGGDYLARYVALLAGAGGAALAVLAVAPAVVAAIVAALVFIAGAFALRIVPSELTALIPRRSPAAE
jgi:O-antigen/teichoic acid export membrane protein